MGPVHRATTWDNSATTRLEWDRLGLLIRSFWFGVTYLRGKGGKLQWSLLLRLGLCLVCAPVLVSPLGGPHHRRSNSSRLRLTNEILCNGLVVSLLIISPKEVCRTTGVAHDLWVKMCNLCRV